MKGMGKRAVGKHIPATSMLLIALGAAWSSVAFHPSIASVSESRIAAPRDQASANACELAIERYILWHSQQSGAVELERVTSLTHLFATVADDLAQSGATACHNAGLTNPRV